MLCQAVNAMTGVLCALGSFLNWARRSKPSMPGRPMSSRMRSNSSRSVSSRAWPASRALLILMLSPCRHEARIPSRPGSSSIRRMREAGRATELVSALCMNVPLLATTLLLHFRQQDFRDLLELTLQFIERFGGFIKFPGLGVRFERCAQGCQVPGAEVAGAAFEAVRRARQPGRILLKQGEFHLLQIGRAHV